LSQIVQNSKESASVGVLWLFAGHRCFPFDRLGGAGGSLHPAQGLSSHLRRVCLLLSQRVAVCGSSVSLSIRNLHFHASGTVYFVHSQHFCSISVRPKLVALWRTAFVFVGEKKKKIQKRGLVFELCYVISLWQLIHK
jgi:hypothetical protein